jgi:hypothetical protein
MEKSPSSFKITSGRNDPDRMRESATEAAILKKRVEGVSFSKLMGKGN